MSRELGARLSRAAHGMRQIEERAALESRAPSRAMLVRPTPGEATDLTWPEALRTTPHLTLRACE
jgi:hypothetical protein